jgi:hypothetical protein
MELFRITSKVVITCDVHAYLGYTIIAIPKQLMCTAPLINKMLGKAPTSVIDSMYCKLLYI